jgi:hypothetical protein
VAYNLYTFTELHFNCSATGFVSDINGYQVQSRVENTCTRKWGTSLYYALGWVSLHLNVLMVDFKPISQQYYHSRFAVKFHAPGGNVNKSISTARLEQSGGFYDSAVAEVTFWPRGQHFSLVLGRSGV